MSGSRADKGRRCSPPPAATDDVTAATSDAVNGAEDRVRQAMAGSGSASPLPTALGDGRGGTGASVALGVRLVTIAKVAPDRGRVINDVQRTLP